MSKRLAVAVLVLLNVAAVARAEDSTRPDIEGLLSPRVLVAPPPGGTGPSSLRLAWSDPAGAALGLEPFVREEASSLLEAMGVRTRWRRAASDELARAGEVRVIFLDRPATRDGGLLVLGATPPSFAVAPHVWIHVASVRATLGVPAGRPSRAMGVLERRVLGVALGRVVAHELVHAIAPEVPHGRGLMAASLGARTLAAASIPVDPEVGGAVRAALRGGGRRAPSDAAVLAASAGVEGVR